MESRYIFSRVANDERGESQVDGNSFLVSFFRVNRVNGLMSGGAVYDLLNGLVISKV